ncbi:hypothetical protein GQX74_014650 [Glossina fuscipes]|nr:hypothetical protein GQX74_014650 [Glossina fuscipes]
MVELFESPAPSNDEPHSCVFSSCNIFGCFKYKSEDGKYLEIMYKLMDILKRKIQRDDQEKKRKEEKWD